MTIGIGIIGIGRHADRYLAPAVLAADGAHLAAIWSRSAERATRFAAQHGAPKAYDDLDALLDDPAVSAVIVASPNGVHADHAIRAARAGKHVLLEKPMATTVADAEAIAEACEKAGVTLALGFHMRHHPAHQEARRLVTARALGVLLMASVQYAVGGPPPGPAPAPNPEALKMMGGGIAMGIGVHLADLLRFVTGRDIEAVSAFCLGRPSEHQATALLRMTGGFTAHLDCGRGYAKPANEVAVYGTEGTVVERGAVVGGHSGIYIVASVEYANLWGSGLTQHRAERVFVDEVRDFVDAIEQRRPPLATAADGIAAQQAIAALYASADERREASLPG